MNPESSPGPFRRFFSKGEGLFRYLSPGFLVISALSFATYGIILGFVGVFLVLAFSHYWNDSGSGPNWLGPLSPAAKRVTIKGIPRTKVSMPRVE